MARLDPKNKHIRILKHKYRHCVCLSVCFGCLFYPHSHTNIIYFQSQHGFCYSSKIKWLKCIYKIVGNLIHWAVFGERNHAGSLQWRYDGRDGVSNHQRLDCLLNRLFRRRTIKNKTSKLRVTGLCEGNSMVTGEFPAQMVGNAENVSIWWHHHDNLSCKLMWALRHAAIHQSMICKIYGVPTKRNNL